MADVDIVLDQPPTPPAREVEPARGSGSGNGRVHALWVELRPSQWLKNLFVLAPLFFSQHLFAPAPVGRALAAMGLFCLMSSAIYLLNDLNDQEQDRLHPQKRHRPLASGALGERIARVAMWALWIASLAAGTALNLSFAVMLAGYWLLNVLYAIRLKHVVILDVFAVAAGYLLRVMGGAVVIHVEMSSWLLICTTLLALFIALCKRRHEILLLEQEAQGHRQVLGAYSLQFLDLMIGMITASAVVSYTLYTVSEGVVRKVHSPGLLLTVPFVLYGFFRYLYLVYCRVEGGDPTQSILTDRSMLVNLFLWAATAGVMLYWRLAP